MIKYENLNDSNGDTILIGKLDNNKGGFIVSDVSKSKVLEKGKLALEGLATGMCFNIAETLVNNEQTAQSKEIFTSTSRDIDKYPVEVNLVA